jgi:hypothetical protein
MASFNAALVLGNQPEWSSRLVAQYPITIGTQQMHQDVDRRGRPVSRTYPGEVHLTMPVPAGTELIAWANDPHKALPCSIIFSDLDGLGPSLVLRLENALCVSYAEHFQRDADGHVAFFCQLTLVAEKFTKQRTDFPNTWKY